MTNFESNDQWRPGERPDEPPTHPYDSDLPTNNPVTPDPVPPEQPPLPPDVEPQPPVREPETPMPQIDPPGQQAPERLV